MLTFPAPSSDPDDRSTDDLVPFRCEAHPHRNVVTVLVFGELDIATVPRVDELLGELRDAGFEAFVVDLTGVTFTDSSGVHLILTWTAASRERGHRFGVIPGVRARAVFAATGTLDLVPLVGGRDAGAPAPPGAA